MPMRQRLWISSSTPLKTPRRAAGGAWEILVGLIKRILEQTLPEGSVQEATFIGILLDAENSVNSRPLVDVPIRHPDEMPITPNHFLLGGPSQVAYSGELDRVCLKGQWEIRQRAQAAFWAEWLRQYIPMVCLKAQKWTRDVPRVKQGDVVIFGEPGAERGTWVKGRVMETMAGPDGVVRSAKVKTATGVLHRPAARLAVLDVA